MSLILPRRFKGHPQAPLQPAPEYADAVILSPLQMDGRNIANSNHLAPFAAGTTAVIRDHGRAMNFTGASSYRSAQQIVHTGKRFTLFAWVRPAKVHDSYFRFLATDYPTGLYLGSDSFGKYTFTVNGSALEGNAGGQQVIGKRDFVCGVYDGSNAITYVNGKEVSRLAVTAPTSLQYLGVGASPTGTSPWTGDVDTAGVFYRAFSAGEVREIYENPARLFKSPSRRLWAVPSGSTSNDLVGSNATQANAASAAAISQVHALSVQSSAQANAASAAAITQGHALTGSASAQLNTAASGVISQGSQFATDPATQANTAGTGAITQAHALTGANSAQPNTASAASLTQAHTLTGASATQPNTATQGAISQGAVHDLTAAATTQANVGSAGAITQAHILVSAPSIQDNIAAASAIVQAHVLAASSVTQSNSASSGAISTGDNVLVSIVKRTAVFRRSKSVTIRFN